MLILPNIKINASNITPDIFQIMIEALQNTSTIYQLDKGNYSTNSSIEVVGITSNILKNVTVVSNDSKTYASDYFRVVDQVINLPEDLLNKAQQNKNSSSRQVYCKNKIK